MTTRVDDQACTACGLCVDTCPEVFQMGEDEEVAVVIGEAVPPAAEETCRQAAEECPTDAITIIEE